MMKKILFMALMLTGMLAFAQDDAPKIVKDQFKAMFPKATDVEWYDMSGSYEVQFLSGEDWKTALFESTGKWIETLKSVEEEEVPAAAINAVKAKYSESDLYNFYFVEQSDKVTCYQLLANTDYINYTVRVTKEGKIIKEIKEESEE